MSWPVVFHIEVQEDVDGAFDWYEGQREGLGYEFLDELFRCLDQIAENEHRFAIIHENVRAGIIRRFPYVVYYRFKNERIEVLAVRHGRRHPKSWHRRNQ